MKECRRKTMSIELCFTCVNDDYFDTHYRVYYEYLSCDVKRSKLYGKYLKTFYKLRPYEFIVQTGLDKDLYCELPFFVCASKIY